MKYILAGVVGGISAGALGSVAQVVGQDQGLVHKTLAQNARDWLTTQVPRSSPLHDLAQNEHAVHFGVAALLGAAYGILRPVFRFLPASVAGAAFGAGLYYVNTEVIGPKVGVTEGEERAPQAVSRERLMVNMAFGVVTGLVVAALVEGRHHD